MLAPTLIWKLAEAGGFQSYLPLTARQPPFAWRAGVEGGLALGSPLLACGQEARGECAE